MTRIPKRVHKKVQDYETRIDELRGEMEKEPIEMWEENVRKKNILQVKKMNALKKYISKK